MAVAYDGGVLMGADSRTTYVCYEHMDTFRFINLINIGNSSIKPSH